MQFENHAYKSPLNALSSIYPFDQPIAPHTLPNSSILDLYDIFVVRYTPKTSLAIFCHLPGLLAPEKGIVQDTCSMDAGKPDYAMLKEQAQRLALTRYASKIPRDLQLIGVTPLVMGICEVLKPKLIRPCFQRGDWHYWNLYGEFQVSPHTSWPTGGTRSKERLWIPMWHDWYRIVIQTEGLRGMSFDSAGCIVTLRLTGEGSLETLSFDGATPLEAISKATLELLA